MTLSLGTCISDSKHARLLLGACLYLTRNIIPRLLVCAPQDLFMSFNNQMMYFCPWGEPACAHKVRHHRGISVE